jgi:phage-related minor tail protein
MASKLQIFKNKIHDVAITIGDAMMPYITKLLEVGNKVLDWVGKLNPKLLGLVGVFGAVGVAIGAVLVVFGTLANSIGGAVTAFDIPPLIVVPIVQPAPACTSLIILIFSALYTLDKLSICSRALSSIIEAYIFTLFSIF